MILWHIAFMHRWLSFVALLALLIVFRLVGAWQGWMNFSPLPVLFLFSAVCFQGRERWLLPSLAWLITDPFLNLMNGQSLLVWDQLGLVLGILSTFVLVPWLRSRFTVSRALVSALVAAVLFYFVTNTISFFSLPAYYPRSFEGFVQAQWTGPVGLGPTWIFLRNACAANLLFGVIFLLALRPLSSYLPVRSQASV